MPVPGYHPPMGERVRFWRNVALLAALLTVGWALLGLLPVSP